MPEQQIIYDLEKRTAAFGEATIEFCKRLPRTDITIPIVRQLVRSGTAIGANYCEADCAESKKDFEHKLSLANKEAKETEHWLKMSMIAAPGNLSEAQRLWQEAHELNLILITIICNSRRNTLLSKIKN